MKSKAELTPAERLLNRCSWCLMPPMIMQIPCADAEMQQVKEPRCHVMLTRAGLSAHRYEEDAAEQSAGERRFDDLFITFGAGAVSPQQRRDVESNLRDGAKGGIHHRSHGKITLCRQATQTGEDTCCIHMQFGPTPSPLHVPLQHYLAIPMPMK